MSAISPGVRASSNCDDAVSNAEWRVGLNFAKLHHLQRVFVERHTVCTEQLRELVAGQHDAAVGHTEGMELGPEWVVTQPRPLPGRVALSAKSAAPVDARRAVCGGRQLLRAATAKHGHDGGFGVAWIGEHNVSVGALGHLPPYVSYASVINS